MPDSEIFDAIVAAVREETGDPDAAVTPPMTASDISGWDSLMHVRIMFNVSVRLATEIDVSETYRAANIGELVPIFRAALKRT